MKPIYNAGFFFFGAVTTFTIPAAAQECSTEKVNHTDCTVTIDRSYPVGPPTFQMSKNKKVTVQLLRALPFESASLDSWPAQAVAGTDQTAAIVASALAQAKSLVFAAPVTSAPAPPIALNATSVDTRVTALYDAITSLRQQISGFAQSAVRVYEELQEVVGTIPPQTLATGVRLPASPLATASTPTPRPWDQFLSWRSWMLCEIGGSACPDDPSRTPSARGLLGVAADIMVSLGD